MHVHHLSYMTKQYLHFFDIKMNFEGSPKSFSAPVCYRLHAVNISALQSCIWRQAKRWVRLTLMLRAGAQESL